MKSPPPPKPQRRERPSIQGEVVVDKNESNRRAGNWLLVSLVAAFVLLSLALLICVLAATGYLMVNGSESKDRKVAENLPSEKLRSASGKDSKSGQGNSGPKKEDAESKGTDSAKGKKQAPNRQSNGSGKSKNKNSKGSKQPSKSPNSKGGAGTSQGNGAAGNGDKSGGQGGSRSTGGGKKKSNQSQPEMDDSLIRGGFFGIQDDANSLVYVVDVSGSMGMNGRYEKARQEVLQAVKALTAKQRFFVIFYSTDAYPMMNMYPMKMLEPTTKNVNRLDKWMRDFQIGGDTQPLDAMLRAIRLGPETIFFLTDGEFPESIVTSIKAANRNKIRINTIGFQIQKGEDLMKKIATDSGGTYQYVK